MLFNVIRICMFGLLFSNNLLIKGEHYGDDRYTDDSDDGYLEDCSWLCPQYQSDDGTSSSLGDGTCNYWCSGSDCEYDMGDCLKQCGNDGECALDNIFVGECGIFWQPTDKWGEFDGSVVCCAQDNSECCDANLVSILVTTSIILVLISSCVWGCCCKKRRDNTNEQEPRFCYKLCCPICSIFSYQGNESRGDLCMTCLCCCIFSLCCWTPKRVAVDTGPENNNNSIEMVVAHEADDIHQIKQAEIYTKINTVDTTIIDTIDTTIIDTIDKNI